MALALVACGQTQDVPDRSGHASGALPSPQSTAEPDRVTTSPATDRSEEPSPPAGPALNPEAERGERGARDVLLDFVRAVELGRYGQARSMLSPPDRKKWSEAEFAAIFADLDKITIAAPNGQMEGAAGSSYYTAPLTVTGTDKNGRPVRLEGEAVLRRVNDVDGATPAQLRWHFQSLTLDWTH
ncbi:conserved hypothetical protein (plasmid) [Novosphingobium sp. PP1Y]|nr:conserved hypothetical protein [Novosphingobium sp. PP1Y]